MVAVSKLPPPSYASPIEEAQALVRQCAEPRPAGDQVKAAILALHEGWGCPSTERKTSGMATLGGSMRKKWTGYGR